MNDSSLKLNWPQPSEFPTLATGEIHVWAIPLEGATVSDEMTFILSNTELERANGFVFEEPRNTFVITRIALRSLLGRYVDTPPRDVSIEIDRNGKPHSPDGEPYFSIAHSGQLTLIAITRDGEIGVDVEQLRPVKRPLEIAARNFHPHEQAAVRVASSDQVEAIFLRCWTRKEAVLKAIGAGLDYPLAAFDALGSRSSDEVVDMIAHGDCGPCRCRVREIDPCSDYAAAVASLAEGQSLLGFTYSL